MIAARLSASTRALDLLFRVRWSIRCRIPLAVQNRPSRMCESKIRIKRNRLGVELVGRNDVCVTFSVASLALRALR